MYRIFMLILSGLVSLFVVTASISCSEREEGKPEKKVSKKAEKRLALKQSEGDVSTSEGQKQKPEGKTEGAAETKKEPEKPAPGPKAGDTKPVDGLIKEVMSINDYIQALPEKDFASDADSVKEDVEGLLLDDAIGNIKERDIMASAFLDMVSGMVEDEIEDKKVSEELMHRIDALIQDIEGRGWTSPTIEKRKKAGPKGEAKEEGKKGGQGKSQ